MSNEASEAQRDGGKMEGDTRQMEPSPARLRDLFPSRTPHTDARCCPHLFDVQEILGLKGDGHSLHGHLVPG